MPKRIAWSYSRLTTFERCPAQMKYKLDRVPEAASPAMERGSRIHKDAEEYLLGKHKQVPATLQGFEGEFKDLRKQKAVPEAQIAVNEFWEPVKWFDSAAWLRIVIDAQYAESKARDVLIDFKTGRAYPDHLEQLELYALVYFKLKPKLREVEGELWYLDQQDITHDTFPSSQTEALEAKWRERAEPLVAAQEFPATPGRHCNWCPFSSAKGGPCLKDRG